MTEQDNGWAAVTAVIAKLQAFIEAGGDGDEVTDREIAEAVASDTGLSPDEVEHLIDLDDDRLSLSAQLAGLKPRDLN